MVYCLSGNRKTLFEQHGGLSAFLANDNLEQTKVDLSNDIDGAAFLGTKSEHAQFKSLWQEDKIDLSSYASGNMTGEILAFLFYGTKDNPFVNNETQQVTTIAFGYIDDQGKACSLLICYRQDDPRQWIIGSVTNANATYEQQDVKLLSSVAPLKWGSNECLVEEIDDDINLADFLSIQSDRIKIIIDNLFLAKNFINPNLSILKLLTHNGGLVRQEMPDENWKRFFDSAFLIFGACTAIMRRLYAQSEKKALKCMSLMEQYQKEMCLYANQTINSGDKTSLQQACPSEVQLVNAIDQDDRFWVVRALSNLKNLISSLLFAIPNRIFLGSFFPPKYSAADELTKLEGNLESRLGHDPAL